MKIIRKIIKVDSIIKNIEKEKLQEEEERKALAEKQEPEAKKESSTIPKIKIRTTLTQIWTLLSGIRRKLPSLFILMSVNSVINLFSISMIIPFVLVLQNSSYAVGTTDISHFSSYKKIVILFSRYVYRTLGLSDPNTLVIIFGAAFIVIFIFRMLLGLFVEYKINIYGAKAMRHFSSKIFSVLMYISYMYYLGRTVSKNLYVISLATKNYGIILGLFNTINDVLLMSLIGIGIAIWTPPIVFVGLIVTMITLIVYRTSHNEIQKLGRVQLEIDRKNQRTIYQGIHNFTLSRLFHAEPFFLKKFHTFIDKSIPVGAYRKILNALPRITIEILVTISFVGYAVYVIAISQRETIEDIMTTAALLTAAVLKLMPASLRITGYLGSLSGDQIAVNEFYKEYTTAQAHRIDDKALQKYDPFPFHQEIKIENVSFSYPEFDKKGLTISTKPTLPVIKGISFSIKKGEKIGVIGGSGGGKTTLMHLLMAFLTPQKGRITIDGTDIRTEMRRWYKNIGYVPQETMLINGSVLDNIGFGIEKQYINKERVYEVLKSAHILSTIEKLPNGIHTNIGDNGKRLSGGQRQRLGIARALYREPNIIFFDEATSNLDNHTEREIQHTIDALSHDITIVIVAHRLNTLQKCDRILCIEDGEIAFEGSYKKMIKKYG